MCTGVIVVCAMWQRTGTNRKESFEGAREWRYYAKVEDLVTLLEYLDTIDHSDMKLAKRLQAQFQALLPANPKSSGEQPVQQDATSSVHALVVAAVASAPVAPQSAYVNTEHMTAGGAAGDTGADVQQDSSRALIMQLPDPFRMFPKKNGEYLAEDDETPKMIASKFAIDLDTLVSLNRHMYEGLHAAARFKGGTLVFLPAPSMAGLKRPVTATPLDILSDLFKIMTTELETLPLCSRISKVLADWKAVMQELLADKEHKHPAQRYRMLAHATLSLEHLLALPLAHWAEDGDEPPLELRAIDARLLPAHWISSARQTWVLEMESVSTMAQMGLLLEELQLFAFAGLRDIRRYSTSHWFFNAECRKLQKQLRGRDRMGRAIDVNGSLIYVPEVEDRVIYFRKGHLMHLSDAEYPERPWDSYPDARLPMALCSVEEKSMYRQRESNGELANFCAIRLQPICRGKDLVKQKIFLHNWTVGVFSGQVVLPVVPCTVTDFRQTLVDVPHVPVPEGGGIILPNPGMLAPGGAFTPAATHAMGMFSTPGALTGGHGMSLATADAAAQGAAHLPHTMASFAGTAVAHATGEPGLSAPAASEAGAASSLSQTPQTAGGAVNGTYPSGSLLTSVADAAGAGAVVYTQRTVHEYLIRYDAAGVADQWINLDNVKYSMQGARCCTEQFLSSALVCVLLFIVSCGFV